MAQSKMSPVINAGEYAKAAVHSFPACIVTRITAQGNLRLSLTYV